MSIKGQIPESNYADIQINRKADGKGLLIKSCNFLGERCLKAILSLKLSKGNSDSLEESSAQFYKQA